MTNRKLTNAVLTTAFLFPALLSVNTANAQNTGAVFGPVVTEGHRSVEYRAAFDPDSDGFAQRFHYQQALNDRYQLRFLAQSRKTAESDFDFDFVQAELTWDITNANRDWQTGFRFDVRVRDRGRPVTVGVDWTNQFRLNENWQARLLAITTLDLGSGARDGIGLQTRANLYRRVSDRQQLGLEMFSNYGTSADFLDLDEQSHQLGPFANWSLGNGYGVFSGLLVGISDAAPDLELRLFVGRRF